MLRKSNWKMKSLILPILISFVVLPFYSSMGMAQDATPPKAPPKTIELAQAAGGSGAGAGASGGAAGAGATAGLSPIVIYGVAAGVLLLGAGIANSISSGDNTTAHH